MCGLVGVYSTGWSSPEYDIFKKLLFLSVWRGEDSTGIIRWDKDGRLNSRKSLLSSPEFIYSSVSDIIANEGQFKNRTPLVMLGHTRAATKGAVTLRNAHPFGFSKVIGMHNGTIHTSFKNKENFETDSEALYKNINDMGLKEALQDVNAYDTAYALQYVDKEEQTLNFVKNSKRPLWFTYVYGTTCLLWASTKEMLEFVLSMKGLSNNTGWEGDTKERFFTLKPNHLLTIEFGKSPSTAKITDLEIEEKKAQTTTTITTWTGGGRTYLPSREGGEWIKTPRGYIWRPKTTQGKKEGTESSVDKTSYGNFRDDYGMAQLRSLPWLREKRGAEKEVDQQPLKEDDLDDTGALHGLFQEDQEEDTPWVTEYSYKGYQGMSIKEEELRQRLKEGCFSCGCSPSLDDPHQFAIINKIHWCDRTYWACDECYNNSDGDWVRHTVDNDWEIAEDL